jgi:hypothetical protein
MPNFDLTSLMNNATAGIAFCVMVPFIIVGIVFLLFALRSRRKVRESQTWERTSGTVLFSDVDTRGSTDSDGHTSISHYPKIVYEYRVMGQTYRSDRFNLGEVGLGNYNKVAAKVAQYPQGAIIDVYYNPANPVECVLERTAPSSNIMLVVVVVIFASLACTGVMIAGGFALMGNFMGDMMNQLTQIPR